jgi:hypothetical protein
MGLPAAAFTAIQPMVHRLLPALPATVMHGTFPDLGRHC